MGPEAFILLGTITGGLSIIAAAIVGPKVRVNWPEPLSAQIGLIVLIIGLLSGPFLIVLGLVARMCVPPAPSMH